MGRIRVITRERIVEELLLGATQRELARKYKVSRSAIENIEKKQREGYEVKDKQRSGRPTKLNQRDKRKIVIESKRNPFATASEVCSEARVADKLTTRTVSRVLRNAGLPGCISKKKPALNIRQKQKGDFFVQIKNTGQPLHGRGAYFLINVSLNAVSYTHLTLPTIYSV